MSRWVRRPDLARPGRTTSSTQSNGQTYSGPVRKDIKFVLFPQPRRPAKLILSSDYKSSLPSQTDALLGDRGRIDSSHRMMNDTLKCVFTLLPAVMFLTACLSSQAYATREDFAQQRSMLASIDSRMGGVLSQMPGINSLITMIRTRRRRDSIIMGCVVGGCVLLLLGYMFGF